MRIEKGSWRHRNGHLYWVLGLASDATNANPGRTVVVYHPLMEGPLYVREVGEFLERFTREPA